MVLKMIPVRQGQPLPAVRTAPSAQRKAPRILKKMTRKVIKRASLVKRRSRIRRRVKERETAGTMMRVMIAAIDAVRDRVE